MRTNDQDPTGAELEILHILWEKYPRSVKEVHDILACKKDVGYTTTLKIMQNMLAKRIVTRENKGRGHVYSPNIKKSETQQKLVNRFLKATFEGSAGSLVMQVLGNHKPSTDELNKIKEIIKQIEKNS